MDSEDSEKEDSDEEVTLKKSSAQSSAEDDDPSPYHTPHCAGVHLSTIFLATFFRTINREWEGIDQYRLDKIYSLVRKVLSEMYKYMEKRNFHEGIIHQFNDVLIDEVLEKTPNGMRFHVIDIALDELAKVRQRGGDLLFLAVKILRNRVPTPPPTPQSQ